MLYIMRHGRTDWNDLAKLQGQTDIPLNEDGRALARVAAREYRDVHLDLCYCSPLLRAREKALPALIAVPIGLLCAALDELHQLMVDGRSGQWTDILLDSAGVFCGVLLTALILRRLVRGQAARTK